MAGVSVDYVLGVINVGSAEAPDAKVLRMIKRAEATLELEADKQIDYTNQTPLERK